MRQLTMNEVREVSGGGWEVVTKIEVVEAVMVIGTGILCIPVEVPIALGAAAVIAAYAAGQGIGWAYNWITKP